MSFPAELGKEQARQRRKCRALDVREPAGGPGAGAGGGRVAGALRDSEQGEQVRTGGRGGQGQVITALYTQEGEIWTLLQEP